MPIQSVSRAFSILSLFSSNKPVLTLAEVSKELGLAKATAYGIMTTMRETGYLDYDKKKAHYMLAAKYIELGGIVVKNLRINREGREIACRLANDAGVVCRIGIWDRDSILVSLQSTPMAHAEQPSRLGPRVPAYCTALGKAFLSSVSKEELDGYLDSLVPLPYTPRTITDVNDIRKELDTTKERGYSISEEEALLGQSGLGVPILGPEGRPLGAISLSGLTVKVLGDQIETLAGELRGAAGEISYNLGYYPQPVKKKQDLKENMNE